MTDRTPDAAPEAADKKETIDSYFGRLVFDDRRMREYLSPDAYASLKKTIDEGSRLDPTLADEVAQGMKEWALAQGATHFTHWFQPLTGITAEKHDSFVSVASDGRMILSFSGKELIKGEPDASSFPSGGLRATFEARGYTAWDPTSYAFIKGKTLCIPTAFCAYGGEALDKKTPLLRSMQALNRQALRVLRLLGQNEVKSVRPLVGAEQEYFLVDRSVYRKRRDLLYTGRTLFGARPPKGQEMGDHYFGVIKPRVAAFMEDLNKSLWELGVMAKTEHNEVAPAQHELAPVYATANIATDHNQLTMEIMQKVAAKHDLVCLLHEKPFAGVNGSGKHNNWSLSTDTGVNLLSPGKTPHDNVQFLLFLCAVLQAVDDYQDLLRISVASAANDHRLGGHEAPPAVVSVFLGNELTAVVDALINDAPYNAKGQKTMKLGVDVLPRFPQDTTDRNRTSPFAFTGNKFEFRMLGSSDSIACTNIMLNSAVADTLQQYADRLEKSSCRGKELHDLIRDALRAHRRIIFNGNGYEQSWKQEAAARGLSEYPTTPDCLPHYMDAKNREMLTRQRVLSEVEIHSRMEIILDNYSKTLRIEADTMVDMVRQEILPALSAFSASLADQALKKKALLADLDCAYENATTRRLSSLIDGIAARMEDLSQALADVNRPGRFQDVVTESVTVRDSLLPRMEALRALCDEAETITPRNQWPFPTYGDLMFSVR